MRSNSPTNRPSCARIAALSLVAAAGIWLAPSSAALAGGQKEKKPKSAPAPKLSTPVTFTPFGEMNGKEPYNTSGIVAIEDGRFLLVDNKTDDALLELRLDENGVKREPLVRRPLVGLAAGATDDLEGLTWVETGSTRYLVVTSSFNRKHDYDKKGRMVPVEGFADGLLRVTVGADGTLATESVAGFRKWLVAAYPELGATVDNVPDEGGLNIEGLEWDPDRQAILFGVRSPVHNGLPLILPVRIKNHAGPWSLDQFEALPSVTIPVEKSDVGSGVRGIGRPVSATGFIVTIGKGWQGRRIPFRVYYWDGKGTARRLPELHFEHGHKPEGVCVAMVGGKVAGVLADDAGGYAVIWRTDPRIQAFLASAAPPAASRP